MNNQHAHLIITYEATPYFNDETYVLDMHNYKYDCFANVVAKIILPTLPRYHEYASDIEYLILDKIELWLQNTLFQRFNADYLRSINNNITRNDNIIHINIPFDLTTNITGTYGLPLMALHKNTIKTELKLSNNNKLINVKQGDMLSEIKLDIKISLLINYVILSKTLQSICANTEQTCDYTTVSHQKHILDTNNESYENITIYKRYLSEILYPALVDLICEFIYDTKQTMTTYTFQQNLISKKNTTGIIINITNNDPKILLDDTNKLEYFNYIKQVTLYYDRIATVTYSHDEIYVQHPHMKLRDNVGYIKYNNLLPNNSVWGIHVRVTAPPAKYGSYIINVHSVCHNTLFIENQRAFLKYI